MSVFSRSTTYAALAVVACLAMGGRTTFGQGASAPPQLVVAAVEVSADASVLFVLGVNFGTHPAVSLGGTFLDNVSVNPTGTVIAAPMPQLAPGSYLLHVASGRGATQQNAFVVTVGAQGPKGDPGEKGDKGDPGESGAQGDPGAPGEPGANGDRGDKGDKGDKGDQGVQGVPGNVALANQGCGPGRHVRAFDATGTPVCTPTCGDGSIEGNEEFEGGAGPFASAPVSSTSCRFDFSSVTQLFCNGSCSWAGVTSCDLADATVLCRLKTGNANAFATSFQVRTAEAAPGFSCAPSGLGRVVPNMAARTGVLLFPPRYEDGSLLGTHGAGLVVTNVVCSQ